MQIKPTFRQIVHRLGLIAAAGAAVFAAVALHYSMGVACNSIRPQLFCCFILHGGGHYPIIYSGDGSPYPLCMADEPWIDTLVFRTVAYRYRRHNFSFDLSQALFSSAGVDSGTHLLLSLLAEELPLDRYDRVADLGSGTGTLGISLAGSIGCPLEAVDRDACATAFTRRNARKNKLSSFTAETRLVLPEYPGDGRELVVSNLPAKVGEPVLTLLTGQVARRASLSGGESAVVIVKPLADTLRVILDRLGAEIIAERRTANHSAIIFRCAHPTSEPSGTGPLPDEFVRAEVEFPGPAQRYRMRTVYNLPEFDGLSYRTALAFDLLRSTRVTGATLVYGCGQGHLPMGVAQQAGKELSLRLADRDLLALESASRNLSDARSTPFDRLLVPTPGALTESIPRESLSWLIVDDDPTPGSSWNGEISSLVDELLHEQSKILLVSRSTTVSRFLKSMGRRLTQLSERRMHGFRAALLRRRR